MQDGLVYVELAGSANSYCGWCDTPIAADEPRVARSYSHASSQRVEFMHPQCAWHYDDGSWGTDASRRTCAGCSEPYAKIVSCFSGAQPARTHPWDLERPRQTGCRGGPLSPCAAPPELRRGLTSTNATRVPTSATLASIAPYEIPVLLPTGAPPCPRFVPSSGCVPLHYCHSCVGAFVEQHRPLLNGYVGAQQMAAPVAWRNAGTPFALRRGCGAPPLPRSETERVAFLDLFRANTDEAEADALARHEVRCLPLLWQPALLWTRVQILRRQAGLECRVANPTLVTAADGCLALQALRLTIVRAEACGHRRQSSGKCSGKLVRPRGSPSVTAAAGGM